MNYEYAIKKLESTIEQMEDRELTLDDSLKLFQEGIELYKYCNKKLNQAEGKIQMIIKDNDMIESFPFKDREE